MIGFIGFIPLIMAIEYTKNREKYCREYLAISLIYLFCLPIAFYDALLYKEFGEFNWVFSDGVIPYIYRFLIEVSGAFLLFKGLQSIYFYIKKNYIHVKESP